MSTKGQTSSLTLSTDEYDDILGEDLTFLISPGKLSVRSQQSNSSQLSQLSQLSTNSSGNQKVSPIVTDEGQFSELRPALNSLKGYDVNNNPVYQSSQTPHDFQVMTKRKVSKGSIFNFENFDMKNDPSAAAGSLLVDGIASAHPRQPGSFSSYQQEKPPLSPAKGGQICVKKEPGVNNPSSSENFVDLSAMDTSSVPFFLAGINWSSEKSQTNEENSLTCASATSADNNDDLAQQKNPRKKQGSVDVNNSNSSHYDYSMEAAPVYMARPAALEIPYADNRYEGYGNEISFFSSRPLPSLPPQQSIQQPSGNLWINYRNDLSYQTLFNGDPLLVDPHYQYQQQQQQHQHQQLPSIRTLQQNASQNYHQFPFPPPIVATATSGMTLPSHPPGYESYNAHEYQQYPQNHRPSSSLSPPPLQDNYHSILQQKVEAMKLNQTTSSPSTDELSSQHHRSARLQLKQEQQQQHLHYHSSPSVSNSGKKNKENTNLLAIVNEIEDDGKGKNRASKSLAEISKRFVTLYGKDNTMDYISGLVDPDHVTGKTTSCRSLFGIFL
jgi:hypothetical protein